MRNFLLLTLMSLTATCKVSAQNKLDVSLYAAGGLSVWNSFEINKNLENNGLVPINLIMPKGAIGVDIIFKDYYAGLECGYIGSRKLTDHYGYKFNSVALNISLAHSILNFENWSVFGGVSGSYLPASLQILSKQTAINVAEINPSGQPGAIILNNSFFCVGPTICSRLFAGSSSPLFISVAYEWGISKNAWASDYAVLTNSPMEQNNNRFVLKTIVPLKGWSVKKPK